MVEDTIETQETTIPEATGKVTADREIVTIIQPSRGWVSLKLKELWEPLDRSIQPDYTCANLSEAAEWILRAKISAQ